MCRRVPLSFDPSGPRPKQSKPWVTDPTEGRILGEDLKVFSAVIGRPLGSLEVPLGLAPGNNGPLLPFP